MGPQALLRLPRICRRVTKCQWLLMTAICLNVIVYFLLSLKQEHLENSSVLETSNVEDIETKLLNIDRGLPGKVTFVISEFEDFDNMVLKSVQELHKKIDNPKIVVITETEPYPPLGLGKLAKVVNLNSAPDKPKSASMPEIAIETEIVIILPDATDIISGSTVDFMVEFFLQQPRDFKLLAWAASPIRDVHCKGLDVDLKRWTLNYYNSAKNCNSLEGDFVLMVRKTDLLTLPHPFGRPLKNSLFIQTALRSWKIILDTKIAYMKMGKLFEDPHKNWKHQNKELDRVRDLYHKYGIKLVRYADGGEEWFGCEKRSSRCFGTVLNDMPEYLYHGRWTPPCCLRALRITAKYVFAILESQNVRYWLEGGSLLGAARHGDIIPWDFDVDIGIYQEDIEKSPQLTRAKEKPFVDQKGFVWEKAREGEFYRVQYSQSNHLHVDLWPFYSKNGNMTKNTWMKTHKQDSPFPEHYLKPLNKITFAGIQAFIPNNHKEFLEMKFGKGVIENPKYPNDDDAK